MAVELRRIPEQTHTDGARGAFPRYVRIACPHCRYVMTVDIGNGGQPVRCADCSEFFIVPKERYAPSVVVGDFILKRLLGSGMTGAVYLAHQISLDRACALKIIRCSENRSEAAAALLREARLAARLSHPNIVQSFMVGQDDLSCYCAMEYVKGTSLQTVLEDNLKLSAVRSLDIGTQLTRALEYAWKREQIIHRDLTPGNILIGQDGTVKLTDLGLAARARELNRDEAPTSGYEGAHYQCPEQIQGRPADWRGDLFSLGVVLFRCLTGEFPFHGDTEEILRQSILERPAPALGALLTGVPPTLSAVVSQLLEKDPAARGGDHAEVIAKLELARRECARPAGAAVAEPAPEVAGHPVAAKRRTVRVALAAGGVGLAALGASALLIPDVPVVARTVSFVRGTTGFDVSAWLPGRRHETIPDGEEDGVSGYGNRRSRTVPAVPASPPTVELVSALPDPEGFDRGSETVTLRNPSPDAPVDLAGWTLATESASLRLQGMLKPGEARTITLDGDELTLRNRGGELEIRRPDGEVAHRASYDGVDVAPGRIVPLKQIETEEGR